MLTVVFNQAARKELFNSSLFYSKQAPGLGERFLVEVENWVGEISRSPQRYPLYFKDVRRCVMSQFPFGIYYRVEGTKIRILAVAHSSRHPDYWKRRQ
jgi:plasmid stabilization system protein ParE